MAAQDPATTRKIIHIDMDAFFASVEQRDHPELRGRPVAVGGSAQRGVVAAASYEARVFGVRSAMASVTAKRRCPQLIFVPPRFDVYREVSQQIRLIFARYSDLVEPLSLDEAYLDVTRDKLGIGSATRIAQLIRSEIREQTGLTASAGVSYNKFLAKVASDQNKPDGIFVVLPQHGAGFVATLAARRFYGVGPKTAQRMARLGIHVGADLRARDREFLQVHFGKSADYLYQACRGEDHRPVRPDRLRKSIGGERTYGEDLCEPAALDAALVQIIDLVWDRVSSRQALGRTVTLKVKYADFQQITRARSVPDPVRGKTEFSALARELMQSILPLEQGVRLLGLTLSGLCEGPGAAPESVVAEPMPVQQVLQFQADTETCAR
ncbi:DNA polymerase IV [Kineobactrum salinum]|uniref:DNA polymerase IV n=1 Tax=Kineobactrum salinum TaxID=2708301 RepID=A0A6C0U9S5_9GAMM|nr:DNA polymerase IV [Kineobactrum salinum]QIB66454.1 DNA polymerase IV [Kineobactrum salinum]